MKAKLPLLLRVLLGLPYVVFGLNYYLQFLGQPEPSPEGGKFLGALAESGFVFEIIKPVEVFAGALLVLGLAAPFALTLLAPVTVAIVAYHVSLDPAGGAIAYVLLAMHLVVAWQHRARFASLFRAPR